MRVRYQADNDLRKAIVLGLMRREQQVDFRSSQASHLDGKSDAEVLALTATEGRILVSHDFQTMPKQFLQFTRRQISPRVLLIRQDLPVAEALESLFMIWHISEMDEWKNRLCLIPSLATIAIGSVT
jgi:predicted nuclease of predicted toxin-antitoxin system